MSHIIATTSILVMFESPLWAVAVLCFCRVATRDGGVGNVIFFVVDDEIGRFLIVVFFSCLTSFVLVVGVFGVGIFGVAMIVKMGEDIKL